MKQLKKLDEDNPDNPMFGAVLVRGIIFGKHGRVFQEKGIQEYLKTRKWYHPDLKFSNAVLNDTERKNLDTVREEEAKHNDRVKPGDMRFWMSRKVTSFQPDMGYTISDIRILKAEIEAIHGKSFPNEPLLQTYFEDRYWYKPDPGYKFASLSPIERSNLRQLSQLEQKLRGTSFSPEDVISYADKRIPVRLLKPLSLYELRLTRNAFYAMRGHSFKTPWLSDYFGSVEWFRPVSPGETEKLTATDFENIATVLGIEKELHDELSTKPIPHQRLTGLFVEDLRKLANEIPARHGKVFADKSMRNYFSTLPWYKPNRAFKLSDLTKVEKKNYEFLLEASKTTTTQFDMEEG